MQHYSLEVNSICTEVICIYQCKVRRNKTHTQQKA